MIVLIARYAESRLEQRDSAQMPVSKQRTAREKQEMEEDDEVLITDETEEKIEEIAYCNVAYKFICIFIGFVIGVMFGVFL